jgi:hypothetical protein
MSEQINFQAYLASLPEVITARLPYGTIFTSDKLLYQITEAGTQGFRKARQWRGGEETEVALVPNSYLANFLPLVERGKLLPIFPGRDDLLEHEAHVVYLFSEEKTALDAAYLDSALVQSGDVYVRNHGRDPAFAISDGRRLYRLYYYSRSSSGGSTLNQLVQTIQFRMYNKGPMYWRLLPSWPPMTSGYADETLPNLRPV